MFCVRKCVCMCTCVCVCVCVCTCVCACVCGHNNSFLVRRHFTSAIISKLFISSHSHLELGHSTTFP